MLVMDDRKWIPVLGLSGVIQPSVYCSYSSVDLRRPTSLKNYPSINSAAHTSR